MNLSKFTQIFLRYVFILSFMYSKFLCDTSISSENEDHDTFKIEGKVEVVSTNDKEWIAHTVVLVEGGEYIAHLR